MEDQLICQSVNNREINNKKRMYVGAETSRNWLLAWIFFMICSFILFYLMHFFWLIYLVWENEQCEYHKYIHTHIQGDSFGARPKKMRISQRLFIRFWTYIYDYIPCFMRSMSIFVCRSLTSWRHRENDWRLAPCRAQPCHSVVR